MRRPRTVIFIAGHHRDELNHDFFSDQKLSDRMVYGEVMAKKLAKKKTRRARRSSENFEWFCIRLRDPTGKL